MTSIQPPPSMGPFPKETKERCAAVRAFPLCKCLQGGSTAKCVESESPTDRGKGGQSGPGVRLLQIEEKEGSERQKT